MLNFPNSSLGCVVITLTSNVIMNLFLQYWLAITAPTQLLSHPYS